MSNSTIFQHPTEYTFVLGFYGKCTTEECVAYDLSTSSNVVDSTFQVSGTEGSSFAWFKSEFIGQNINHFEQLECGHLYYFVVKPGSGSVEIPHLYITTSTSNSLYEFDDTGRVAEGCFPPKPVCGEGFDNSTDIVNGDIVELDNVSGNFTVGGKLYFNSFGGADGSAPPTAFNCPFEVETIEQNNALYIKAQLIDMPGVDFGGHHELELLIGILGDGHAYEGFYNPGFKGSFILPTHPDGQTHLLSATNLGSTLHLRTNVYEELVDGTTRISSTMDRGDYIFNINPQAENTIDKLSWADGPGVQGVRVLHYSADNQATLYENIINHGATYSISVEASDFYTVAGSWQNGGAVIIVGAELTASNRTFVFEAEDGTCYKADLVNPEGINIFTKI